MIENIKPWILFLFLFACLGAGPSGLPNQPADWKTLFTDDFEDGDADGWAVDVVEGSGAGWEVIKDNGNWVFSGRGHSTARWLVGIWSDFRFKARIKLVQGGVFINYRTQDCDRYFLDFHPGSLVLNRSYPCGSSYTILTVQTSLSLGTWYTVEVVGIESNLKVFMDGVKLIDFTDPSPLLFGGVSLEANPGSQIFVDDVEASGPAVLGIADELVWIKTGGPPGGMGYDIRMRPDNPDVMFATDIFSGVNRSIDGGKTWHSTNKGIVTRTGPTGDAIPIYSLTIDPLNPDVIWVGTLNTRGIYKSTDGGLTWVRKDNGVQEQNGITFRGFTVDPRSSDIVYAAADISSSLWAGKTLLCWQSLDAAKGVVYKTTDGGENWHAVWRGDNLARYIWINPRNPDTVYVSTGIFDRGCADCNPSGGIGILKSTDAGLSWKNLNYTNGLGALRIGSLFMHPQNPDVLLAGGGSALVLPDSGVFLSSDGGESWHTTLSLPLQAGNIGSVEFAVANPNIAYAANDNVFYRSEDGGQTWKVASGPFYGPPGVYVGVPIDIQVDPRNPNRLFINNYGGGNFLSEDGGITWTVASKGYTGANIFSVAVDPRDNHLVYAIGRSGTFRSDDGGQGWKGINYSPINFGDGYAAAVDPQNPNTVIVSDQGGGQLFRSTDRGNTWQITFQHPDVFGKQRSPDWHGFKALAFAPTDPKVVYAGMCLYDSNLIMGTSAGSFGVFKSINGGRTWTASSDTRMAKQNVNVLAIDPRSENIVYAGTFQSGVLRTLDGGLSWTPLNTGIRSIDVRTLAINPQNALEIYAGLENGGLYKTADGGDHWTFASFGLDPNASVRAIVIDPVDPKVVYAADFRSGVYRSEDGGKLWVQINKGLSTRAVKSLALSSGGSTLYAATEGGGVFRLDASSPTFEAKEGDLNGDGVVTMADAIIALQVMAGMQPQGLRSDYATSGADVNGDGKVRLAEILYILQKTAGMR